MLPARQRRAFPSLIMPQLASLLAVLAPHEAGDFFPEPLLSEVRGLAPTFRQLDATQLTPADFQRELAASAPEVLLACWKAPPLPPELPPQLRYVCYLCGSVKKLVTRAHLERGLLVSNWGDAVSRNVAEAGLLHILSCLRNAAYWNIAMHRDGGWKNDRLETSSLLGRRVGFHGFGRVARALVKLLQPFDTTISVFAPDLTPALEREFSVQRAASLDALFAENDIIVELAPLIPATRGCVTERHLRLIRPGGVFVNIGRGAVVDEAGLIRVAQEGRVRLGLDVFDPEPLPAAHPLRGLPNVTLTPHIGGPTSDRRRDAGAFALRNLRAYAAGRPLEAVVTPQVFDASS
jgi:phosphoglycerate dehydrogenase-like enzyme